MFVGKLYNLITIKKNHSENLCEGAIGLSILVSIVKGKPGQVQCKIVSK